MLKNRKYLLPWASQDTLTSFIVHPFGDGAPSQNRTEDNGLQSRWYTTYLKGRVVMIVIVLRKVNRIDFYPQVGTLSK